MTASIVAKAVEDASEHQPFRLDDDKPEYRAPEGSFNFASDIFSVSVVIFEMATGELPSAGRDLSIIEEPAKAPSRRGARPARSCIRGSRPSRPPR